MYLNCGNIIVNFIKNYKIQNHIIFNKFLYLHFNNNYCLLLNHHMNPNLILKKFTFNHILRILLRNKILNAFH